MTFRQHLLMIGVDIFLAVMLVAAIAWVCDMLAGGQNVAAAMDTTGKVTTENDVSEGAAPIALDYNGTPTSRQYA